MIALLLRKHKALWLRIIACVVGLMVLAVFVHRVFGVKTALNTKIFGKA